MNKAIVKGMVDATWIWDAGLCRMDWANQEGLDFIGMSNLEALRKIRYNPKLSWVGQLNQLSQDLLPEGGAMEKILFPNDVILNCWVKNHKTETGHVGLWIILKQDHYAPLGSSKPSADLIRSYSGQKPGETNISLTPDKNSAEREHDEVTSVKRQEEQTDSAQAKDAHEQADSLESKEEGEARDSHESGKILALIARQINAKTGMKWPQKKVVKISEPDDLALEKDNKKDAPKSLPKSEKPDDKDIKKQVAKDDKINLPGMAALVKQVKGHNLAATDIPDVGSKPATETDIGLDPAFGVETDGGAEAEKPGAALAAVSNSDGIHEAKRVSDTQDWLDEKDEAALIDEETGEDKSAGKAEIIDDAVTLKTEPKPEKKDKKSDQMSSEAKGDTKGDSSEGALSVIDHFPVASAVLDKDGKFIVVSELFSLALGYSSQQEFLQTADIATILPFLSEKLPGHEIGSPKSQIFENSDGRTKSGRRIKVSLGVNSQKNEDVLRHYLVMYPTGVDLPSINSRAMAEEKSPSMQTEISEAGKGQPTDIKDEYERTLPFLAKVSHEIRTPLNSIIGFSELMKEEQFGPVKNERYLGYMDDIYVSANHALSLVNDMLDISRIQAGSMELERESLDFNEGVQSAIKSMAPQFAAKDIHVWQGLSGLGLSIDCDKRSLRQIILNLLSNAVKYTPKGGQISVTTALEKDGFAVLRIRDTGIGMSETDIEQAMKPFQRLDTILRHETNGSGLGLPLTKALVEANKAVFKIESAVDQGTMASVLFPPVK